MNPIKAGSASAMSPNVQNAKPAEGAGDDESAAAVHASTSVSATTAPCDEGITPPLNWLFGLCFTHPAPGGTAHPESSQKTKPLPPTQDPWYTSPPSFETKRPGEILRIRPAPGDLTAIVGNSLAGAYNILYRTTNSQNQASWAVTTLLIPRSVYFSPSGKAALLSYQFAYNSANLDSSPSVGLYEKLAQDNKHLGLKSSTSFLGRLLSEGWIVNTPDFAGPLAAFGATSQAGHATLDSLRAVQNLACMTGSTELSIAIWGYSGGSIATAAAAELQPLYAPELKLAGSILGGTVTDLPSRFDGINKSPIAGTLAAIILGITADYPEARVYLKSRLLPETKDEFLSVLDTDANESVVHFAKKDIYKFFHGGKNDLFAPIMLNLYETQMRIGNRSVPTMPMFIYHAITDQFCTVDKVDELVSKWIRGGADVLYERNTVGEHVSEIENGKPRAMAWLRKIFDESYEPSSAPNRRNVTVEVPVEEK